MSIQEIMTDVRTLSLADRKMLLQMIRASITSEAPLSVDEIAALAPEDRDRYLAQAFALAADEAFEIFEAYSEESLFNWAYNLTD